MYVHHDFSITFWIYISTYSPSLQSLIGHQIQSLEARDFLGHPENLTAGYNKVNRLSYLPASKLTCSSLLSKNCSSQIKCGRLMPLACNECNANSINCKWSTLDKLLWGNNKRDFSSKIICLAGKILLKKMLSSEGTTLE